MLNLSKGAKLKKSALKNRIDRVCVSYACIDLAELDKALREMSAEKLIEEQGEYVQLTPQGQKLGKEWESLLLKKEPIMEVVAGLVDGSVTSLVVILSAFIATLTQTSTFLSNQPAIIFAAFLTLERSRHHKLLQFPPRRNHRRPQRHHDTPEPHELQLKRHTRQERTRQIAVASPETVYVVG